VFLTKIDELTGVLLLIGKFSHQALLKPVTLDDFMSLISSPILYEFLAYVIF